MTEEQKQEAVDFSGLTTQELEELLRLDADTPDGQEAETILQILDELERRKQADTSEITPQQSWESFQKHYLPETEAEPAPQSRSRMRLRRWILVAAVIALLSSLAFSSGASERNLPEDMAAVWGDGGFRFVSTDHTPEAPEGHLDIPSAPFGELFDNLGNGEEFVPDWLPEGYDLLEYHIGERPGHERYVVWYQKGENLVFSAKRFNPLSVGWIEVNNDLEELYTVNGTDYYIFYNYQRMKAIWYEDSYVYYISGSLTKKELKDLILAIEKEG